MIVELDAKQIETNPVFPNAAAKAAMLTKFGGVVGAAGELEGGLNGSRKQAQLKRSARRQGKSNVTPGEPTTKVELGRLADNLRKAIGNVSPNPTGLLEYLELYGCALLNAGCFAAGTKLWTPDGYRNVEDIQVGDLLFSRDEGRPDGLVEAKPVEQVFRRFTEVVHLHVGGRVIRTTDEHPFYVYNKGWVPVAKLAARDYLLTAAGDWKPVEEVYRTGELEVVYNLRVADHHTYFVGDESWGWAAWAHNHCDIALGVREYLTAFRDAVCPQALIYTEWQTSHFITPTNDFGVGLEQALNKAEHIYFNLEGITDVPLAVARGTRGYRVGWPNQATNYTNFELFQLSFKSAHDAAFSGKILWYNGTTPTSAPANFLQLWDPSVNPLPP